MQAAKVCQLTAAAPASQHPQASVEKDGPADPANSYALCTGTLTSPTVVLTAAHANPGLAQVKVTFESVVQNAAVM